jgi:hypothetical protein
VFLGRRIVGEILGRVPARFLSSRMGESKESLQRYSSLQTVSILKMTHVRCVSSIPPRFSLSGSHLCRGDD